MFYSGIVEDRNDPLELGRYRVRVFGIHSMSKEDIPIESLPWAQTIQPVTSAANSGSSITPALVEGSLVLVFFLDGNEYQMPIIFGSIAGIGDKNSFFVNGEAVDPDDLSTGFLSKVKQEYNLQPDLPKSARSGAVDNPSASIAVEGSGGFEEPEDLRSRRRYPYNNVRQSEAGHVEEWDNTPGNERIRTQHRSGTMQEFRPDGTFHQKIFGDRYTIIAAGDNVYVEGNCNIHLNSDVNMYVGGNYTLNVAGDYELNVKGDKYENVVGDVTHNTEGFKQEMAGDEISLSSASHINIGASGDLKTTSNGDTSIESIGNLNLGANTDMNVLARGNMMLATTGNVNLAATGSAWFNVDGTFRMNSGGAMNIGSTGAMSVGSAAAVRLTGSTVDINDGGSAPAVVATNVEIDEFELPEFEAPGVEFEMPAIVSVEPDLETFSTQTGTVSRNEYVEFTQRANASPHHNQSASYDIYNTQPSTGSNSVNNGGSGGASGIDPSTYQAKGGIAGLLEFIGKGEGSYDAANNGTVGNKIVGSTMLWKHPDGRKLSELTIGEIMELQKGKNTTGRTLFAVGRYQIIPVTMRSLAFPRSGLTSDDVFSPKNQDTMGIALLVNGQRPSLAAYLQGRSDDIFAAQMDFAKEWASVPRPDTGRSYYGNGNKSAHSVAEVQAALKSAREEFTGQSQKQVEERNTSNVTYDEFGDPIPKTTSTTTSSSGPQ